MKYRHGLLLVAALSLTAGCGVTEATTQTSMLRGPTPSSGLSIPRLLEITSPSASDAPATAGEQPSAVEPSPPAESVDPAPATEELPAETISTDQPDQTVAETTGDASGGPDLSAVAASFGCTDFVDGLPEPLAVNSAVCVLDDQQILLYSFSTEEATAAYASSLQDSGVTTDELMVGSGYVIWADPAPIATIKAALGAG